MNFIFKLVISTLAIVVTASILPGVSIDSPWTALVLAATLAFLNAIVKPLMIILTIPITIFTLGLFLIFINAFIILFATYIVDGFHVNNFWWAFLFGIILSLVTSIFESIGKPKNTDQE
ncbi:MAG: phage holin family protein [Bacteroidia bacterium]|nr:phage holin family protein [Bacteroidia bacterium]MCZ2248964.1 phage holin family protein [Bacteroidia bacterium]